MIQFNSRLSWEIKLFKKMDKRPKINKSIVIPSLKQNN